MQRFPHRISVISLEGEDSTGVPEENEVAVHDGIRAEIKVLTGRESWAPEGMSAEVDAACTVHYRNTIKRSMQIKHGDDIYEITNLIPNYKKTLLHIGLKRNER